MMGFRTLDIRKQRTTLSDREERDKVSPTAGLSPGRGTGEGPAEPGSLRG